MTDEEHSRYSPSGADRWVDCPASVSFCEKHGLKSVDNVHSIKGTAAHALLEKSLATRKSPEVYRGQKFNGLVAGNDMIDPVDLAGDYVRAIAKEGTFLLTEKEVPIPEINGKGHVDVIVVDGVDALHIMDYKNGRHRVSPVENKQMMLYALGAIRCLKMRPFRKVVLHIIQPNANSNVGESWETTEAGLREWAKRVIAPAVAEIESGGMAEFGPSDKACHWCPAKGICRARAQEMIAVTRRDFAAPGTICDSLDAAATPLAPKEIAYIISRRKAVIEWLSSVEVEAMKLAIKRKLPGYKVVAGKGGRQWNAEAEEILLKAKLGDAIYADRKIRGIGAIEKLAKNPKLIAKATTYHEGKPQLATQDDPRKPLGGDAKIDFQEFTQSQDD